ncbi:STAS domain-containing protein [Streptomyces sp. NPDC086182]|jgi:anti-anti-sigma factor|uniref:STAS domain-containing protein n=1 Tax=Streptomyces sp. NPDC086182 TaxID=3155058 RepID=UPI00341814B4
MHETAEQPCRLSINRTIIADIRVLVLSGEIDADNVGLLSQALQIDDNGPVQLVIDLGAVTFMDSSAISALAAARRDATSAGGWIRVAALTAPVQRVVEIVGLDTIIPCYPTLSQALLP